MTNPLHHYGGSTFSFMWKESALSAMRTLQTLGLNTWPQHLRHHHVTGHLWHDALSAAARASLAASLRTDGIRIDSLNLPALDQHLASCISEARAYAVSLYAGALQLSADLGDCPETVGGGGFTWPIGWRALVGAGFGGSLYPAETGQLNWARRCSFAVRSGRRS